MRAQIHYRLDDQRSVEAGANLFFGERDDTFFGQLKDNANIYTAFRVNY